MNKQQSRITIADVAQAAGVSTATVSRVINQTGNVTSATAERVKDIIRQLDYTPHLGARGLASNRTQTLGFATSTISDLFLTDLLRGIEQTAYAHGYALLVYATQDHINAENRPILPLGQHNSDGLIVFNNSLDEAHLFKRHQKGQPTVLLHRSPPPDTDIPCVTFENKAGAFAMTEHLIAAGHRRIAFLQGPADNEDAAWREKGYKEALQKHGLSVDLKLMKPGNFEETAAATAVTEWLQAGEHIDAIFAADDESARGALQALQQAGKQVPTDIALAGFDDSLLSQYLNPPLTTVKAPIEAAGRVATEQLIRLIQNQEAAPLTLLPTQLVIRRSCGFKR